jgi:hypothetical protein
MAEFLFKVQQQNRLEQKGLLRRFSVNCYGTQLTMEKMREEKASKYKELKKHRGSKEWNWYFLKYVPADIEMEKYNKKEKNKKKTKKNRHTGKKKKTRKRKKSRIRKFLGL